MAADKGTAGSRRGQGGRYLDSDVLEMSIETGLSVPEIWVLIENFGEDREKVVRLARAISDCRKA